MGTLEGQLSFHKFRPHGSCHEVGLVVKNWDSLTKCYTALSSRDIGTDISHPYDSDLAKYLEDCLMDECHTWG